MRFSVFLNTFLRNTTAVVGLEFSLVLPVLLVLFLGMVDITNMIYTKQKISNTAEMFQNFILRPRFIYLLGGNDDVLSKVNNTMILKLIQISNNSGIKMGFAIYIIDAGNVIPAIKNKTDPDPDVPEDPNDTVVPHEDKRTLYIAYRMEIDDSGILNPRLDYERTGRAGTEIDEAYFNKNKLSDNDVIYEKLGGKNNYNYADGDQYVVVETQAEYEPIFSANKYTGLTGIINMHMESDIGIVEDRFTQLPAPDSGNMH